MAEAFRRTKLSAKDLLADLQEFTLGGIPCDDATAIVIRRD